HRTCNTPAHRIGALAGKVGEVQDAEGQHDANYDKADHQALRQCHRNEVDEARDDFDDHHETCNTIRSVLTWKRLIRLSMVTRFFSLPPLSRWILPSSIMMSRSP